MKINTNSWHYKLWRSSFKESVWGVPDKIDLCRYCHRVFWQVISKALACLMAVGCVGALVYGFYVAFILHFILSMECLGAALLLLACPISYVTWLNHQRHPWEPVKEPKTLVGKWLQARKQRVCPMIEFTDENK
jgi:hypothetical protein